MAKWIMVGAVSAALALSESVTVIHFALALIATTCVSLATKE
jgi:hypothetical protein